MNEKHVIIHVGTPKTGSSAIQLFLARNRKLLEKMSIGYFLPSRRYHQWRGDSNADFLIYSILNDIGAGEGIQHVGSLDKECDAFREYCRSYDKLILSDEDLWDRGADHKVFWQTLKDRIEKLCGPDVIIDIVVYFRRQDKWLLSRWKEDIRSIEEATDDFAETVERYRRLGYLDYKGLLERVAEVFAEEHICVRSYDRTRLVKGNATRDFMDVLGIDYHEDLILTKGKVNRAFSMNATEALRLIKLGKVDYDGPWDAIMHALWQIFEASGIKDDSFPMPYQDRRSLIERYVDGNRMIAESYLGDKELFSEQLENYKVWEPDHQRDLNNAEAIVKLAKNIMSRTNQGIFT